MTQPVQALQQLFTFEPVFEISSGIYILYYSRTLKSFQIKEKRTLFTI